MNKIVISSLIVTLPLIIVAKEYKNATKACEAYNNMRHTTNTNEIKLKVGEQYRVLEHKKGQILTLIKGQRVAQRWVDESCFESHSLKDTIKKALNRSKAKSKKTSKQNLLAISWQNAFCQTHQSKKECKNMTKNDFGASNFVLHGLWPQPKNNQYCSVDKKQVGMDKNRQWHKLNSLDLTSDTRDRLAKLMPGYGSNLHKHEWIKHGTCYGTDANRYYDDAMNLLTQINESKVRDYFVKNIGKKISLKDIRKLFDQEFGKGSGEHVSMNCNRGLISELWIHLGSGSDKLKELLKSAKKPKSRCFKGRVDAVGY